MWGRRVVCRLGSTNAIVVVGRPGPHGWGGVGQGGRRQIREGGGILVLIPLLIALIFLAIVVFVLVKKEVDHGRSVRPRGVIIGMTPAALPLRRLQVSILRLVAFSRRGAITKLPSFTFKRVYSREGSCLEVTLMRLILCTKWRPSTPEQTEQVLP